MTVRYEAEDYMAFKMRIISSSSLVGEDLVHKVFGESHYPPLVLCLVVPFLIPTVIALISLLLQLKSLLYSSSSSTERDPVKVRAAVTIFLLTLIFSICNTSSVTHWMRVCLDIEDSYLDEENAVWVYVTGVTIPVLNSVLAPTVLIWRGNSLKERVLDLLMRREERGRVVNNTLSTVVVTRNNCKTDTVQMKEIASG